MLNCVEATRLMSESQERKLTMRERMGLQMHTMMCEGCRNFGKQMKILRIVSHAYAKQSDVNSTSDPGKESDGK